MNFLLNHIQLLLDLNSVVKNNEAKKCILTINYFSPIDFDPNTVEHNRIKNLLSRWTSDMDVIYI